MRLLIVEDNASLTANLFAYFEPRGHQLDAAPDGVVGLHLATSNQYDAIVLDWGLPRMDGLSMLKALREEHRNDVPILLLTARAELPDRVAGFRSGADDYVCKPFALLELEVRLEALVARATGRTVAQVLRIGELEYDPRTFAVSRNGQALQLYPGSRKLLEALMRSFPGAVAKSKLELMLWGDSPPDRDLLRTHVYELRRAIDGPFQFKMIQTVARFGYRIVVREEAGRPASG